MKHNLMAITVDMVITYRVRSVYDDGFGVPVFTYHENIEQIPNFYEVYKGSKLKFNIIDDKIHVHFNDNGKHLIIKENPSLINKVENK